MTIEDEDMKNNTLKKICVVKLATISEGKHIAVGYSDGLVNTFDLVTGKLIGTFQGHRSAITALSYDSHGHMLASGSKVRNCFLMSNNGYMNIMHRAFLIRKIHLIIFKPLVL